MGKKLSLFETKWALIVVLSKKGYSEREVNPKLHCNKTAMHTAIANFNNYGDYNYNHTIHSSTSDEKMDFSSNAFLHSHTNFSFLSTKKVSYVISNINKKKLLA